jgi:hypothetical protein
MDNMRVFGVAAALLLASGATLADPVPGADFVFGSVIAGPNVFDSAEISVADATAFGSATSFASLSDGVLRVKAQPVGGAGNNGNGFACWAWHSDLPERPGSGRRRGVRDDVNDRSFRLGDDGDRGRADTREHGAKGSWCVQHRPNGRRPKFRFLCVQ